MAKWKISCINRGIEEESETEDLNDFFENAGKDEKSYGEDLFKIKRID